MAPPVMTPDRAAPQDSGAATAGVGKGVDRLSAVDQPSPSAGTDVTRRRRRILIVLAMAAFGVLLVALAPPDLSELAEVPQLLANGHLGWLGAALLFKVLSYAGYMALFRAVFVTGGTRIGWRESYAITMAGVAATRLFASAGAGGVALTAWALHRLGVPSRRIAERMVTFLVLLYGVYLACLVVFGLALWAGLLPGSAPWALTLVPALIGALGIAAGLGLGRIPADPERVGGQAVGAGKLRRTLARVRDFFAGAGSGVRIAVAMLRRGEPGLLGAPAWWGFDIAVLWASFLAFGEPPPVAVLVVAYFVGMLGNLLPLPGGAGGVEGGMIGALVAFGVSGGLAVVAVLVYRLFAFWLPTLPGALAYLQLRRDFAGRPSRARPRRAATAVLVVRRRLTYGRLAWLVAAVVMGGAYLAGVFPDLPRAQDAVQTLGDKLGPWSYAVVGGLALLETAALVGLLAPGEWSAIIGGAVAAEGAIGVALLTVTVWACAATGHSLSFLAGRRFGRAFLVRHGPRLRVGPERLDRVDRFFARHGAKAVVGGQFIGLVRAVMPFLAGASGMTYRRFLLPSVVGTGAWAAAFTLLGYFAYRSLAEVEHAVSVVAAVGIALAVLVAGAACVRHRRARHGSLVHRQRNPLPA